MSPDRRLAALLVAALAIAVPAIVLVALCAGRACERAAPSSVRVPFCSLPPEVRNLAAAGFRDGRSPHVLAITGEAPIWGSTGLGGLRDAWPSVDAPHAGRVPLIFSGTGVDPNARIPPGTTLDAVAPTIAEAIDLERAHPEVRSGQAIQGLASGPSPRLVLVIALKRVGGFDIEQSPGYWTTVRRLLREGAGTLEAQVGSLPIDPASALATIGTGGLPRDHGITGTMLRNDRGEVVQAWGSGAPFSVIAALGDDLDESLRQEPRVGLVGTDVTDRGLIGRNWYLDHDRDDVVIARGLGSQLAAVRRLLASGYGTDAVPDLLTITLDTAWRRDDAVGELVESAKAAAGGSVMVVVTSPGSATATGSGRLEVAVSRVNHQVERVVGADVIEGTALGGFFLDQQALARTGITDDRVMDALRDIDDPGGAPLFADVFPQVAVTFARYC